MIKAVLEGSLHLISPECLSWPPNDKGHCVRVPSLSLSHAANTAADCKMEIPSRPIPECQELRSEPTPELRSSSEPDYGKQR